MQCGVDRVWQCLRSVEGDGSRRTGRYDDGHGSAVPIDERWSGSKDGDGSAGWDKTVNFPCYRWNYPERQREWESHLLKTWRCFLIRLRKPWRRIPVRERSFFLDTAWGAAITFQVAWRLENIFHKQPAALIVAGRHPPHFPNRGRYHSDMGTDVLLQEMIRISVAPDYLL